MQKLHEQVKDYASKSGLNQGQVVELILDGFFNNAQGADVMKSLMTKTEVDPDDFDERTDQPS